MCWSTKDIDIHSIMSIKDRLQYKSIDNYVTTINIIMGEHHMMIMRLEENTILTVLNYILMENIYIWN